MSTRSTTWFVSGDTSRPEAKVYRHADGYPEGHGRDLQRFFGDVADQTRDTRFDDPSYLAAKLIVWLAREFATSYDGGKRTSHADTRPLDFLSVGVVQDDPGDVEFVYVVDCATFDAAGVPEHDDGDAITFSPNCGVRTRASPSRIGAFPMTKARALQLLAELVGDDPDYAPALEALRPKSRKAKTTRAEQAAKTILRELRRPDGFGADSLAGTERDYLDTFGPVGSPEREAQAARLRAIERGPSREAFGAPGPVSWVARAAYDWQDDEKRRAADRAVSDYWRYSPQGQAFEAAKAVHEARAAQFAYTPPKTRRDDERGTFALAVLAKTAVEDVREAVAA
jgi:hypothetical protein